MQALRLPSLQRSVLMFAPEKLHSSSTPGSCLTFTWSTVVFPVPGLLADPQLNTQTKRHTITILHAMSQQYSEIKYIILFVQF